MKRLSSLFWFAVAACLAMAPALGQEKAEKSTVSGSWKCTAKAEGRPPSEFRLDLVQKGTQVSGRASRSDGSTDIRSGSFEEGKLKLQVEADGGDYNLEATLSGDKLTGTVTHTNGLKAQWEGVRESAASAASNPILGTWRIRTQRSDGSVAEYALDFKEEGRELQGTITLPDGQTVRMTKASFADNVLKFTVATDEGNYEAEAKLENGKLSGSYTAPTGRKGAWEATRQ